jgi:hypothetical protein
MVLIQVELLDGYGLGPLAIGGFNRAEVLALAADDDDAPASQIDALGGIGTPRHGGKIIAPEAECESAAVRSGRRPKVWGAGMELTSAVPKIGRRRGLQNQP